jgi:hypothetical protein
MTIGTTNTFIPISAGDLSTGQGVTSDPWRVMSTDISWLYDHYSARSPVQIFDPTWYTDSTSYTPNPSQPSSGRGATLSLSDINPIIRPRRAVADAHNYADGVLLRLKIDASNNLRLEIETKRIDGTGQNTNLVTLSTRTLDGSAGTLDYVIPLSDLQDKPLTYSFQARTPSSEAAELRGIWSYEPVPAVAQYPTRFTP